MKNLLFIAVAGLFLFSCGEEGVGFNARKEVGVESELSIPSAPIAGLPTPRREESISFDLEDVSSDLEGLDEVILNDIYYKITGIEPEEELPVQEFTVTLSTASGDITFLDLDRLENTSNASNDDKIRVNLSQSELLSLQNQIFNVRNLDGTIILDLQTFPTDDLEFSITTYFDVTAKIRDL